MLGFQKPNRSPAATRGFTLGQLMVALAIITITALFIAAVFLPLFARSTDRRNPPSCASNLKRISLGLLGYVQDYDEQLPLSAQPLDKEKGILSGWAMTHTMDGQAALPTDSKDETKSGAYFSASPLMSYTKSWQFYRCPSMPQKTGPLSYMMNDLASGANWDKITNQSLTVLLCDGEDSAGNVGHAYNRSLPSSPALYTRTGRVDLGATMQQAPTRHKGGANYGFADGHVKWMTPEKVFFPSRFNNSASHKDVKSGSIGGPDPADTKEMSAKGFLATFHLH